MSSCGATVADWLRQLVDHALQLAAIVPTTVVTYVPAGSRADGLVSVKNRTRIPTVARPGLVHDMVTSALIFPLEYRVRST